MNLRELWFLFTESCRDKSLDFSTQIEHNLKKISVWPLYSLFAFLLVMSPSHSLGPGAAGIHCSFEASLMKSSMILATAAAPASGGSGASPAAATEAAEELAAAMKL